MERLMLVVTYCVLFVATNLTNKYVLSVLHFTYPTLFQVWQTGVGVVVLFGAANRGYVQLSVERSALLPWLPAMMLFVLTIYSGSRALSKMVLPAFITIQNVVEIPGYLVEMYMTSQPASLVNKTSVVIILFAAFQTWNTDPQKDEEGLYWLLIHSISASSYSVYASVNGWSIYISETDRLFCCYFFSVVVLCPASVILGDVVAAQEFPHWYLYEFYIGCMLSGVLGVCTSLTSIRLGQCPNVSLVTSLTTGYAKVALILVSLLMFDGMFSGDFSLSIILGVGGYAVFIVSKTNCGNMTTESCTARQGKEKCVMTRHDHESV